MKTERQPNTFHIVVQVSNFAKCFRIVVESISFLLHLALWVEVFVSDEQNRVWLPSCNPMAAKLLHPTGTTAAMGGTSG